MYANITIIWKSALWTTSSLSQFLCTSVGHTCSMVIWLFFISKKKDLLGSNYLSFGSICIYVLALESKYFRMSKVCTYIWSKPNSPSAKYSFLLPCTFMKKFIIEYFFLWNGEKYSIDEGLLHYIPINYSYFHHRFSSFVKNCL